jgi:hypothetical protein
MATSVNPLTIEQRHSLDQDIADINERIQSIALWMKDCYGEGSQPAIRADQVAGALQRFKWALDREQPKAMAATF